MRLFVVLAGLLMFLTGPAGAADSLPDPTPNAIVPPAADQALACRDFRNRVVHTVEVHALGDAGRAEFVYGQGPVIMIDPELMGMLPANLQMFFKLHECGHHVLGHLFAPTDKSEMEADCWAIHKGRETGIFTRADIDKWRPFFANSVGSNFGHLPGPQRVEFLLGCFDEPER